MKNKYKIVIIDDHPIVRHGLIKLLNREEDLVVCGDADNAGAGWDLIRELKPHMAIVDISLEGVSGIDMIKGISGRMPGFPLLVLSMHDEKFFAERAIRAGAMGYIMKQEATESLVRAIHCVLNGELYLSEKIKSKLLSKLTRGEMEKDESEIIFETLTDRELEVFQLAGNGLGLGDIARSLCLSVKTIDTYRRSIKQKLRLESLSELNQYAVKCFQNGFI